MAQNIITQFKKGILKFLPKQQVYAEYIDRFAKGTDAGFYRLIPQLVVQVNDERQLQKVVSLAHQLTVAITFN